MTSMTSTDSTRPVSARAIRSFAALTGVTALLILLQAVTAGEFVSQEGRESWIAVHSIVSNVTLVVALVVAIFTVVVFRSGHRVLMWASSALFVLLLTQTVLGHLITDAKQDGWIAVHVPVALIVFGLTVWLSIRAVTLRQGSSPE